MSYREIFDASCEMRAEVLIHPSTFLTLWRKGGGHWRVIIEKRNPTCATADTWLWSVVSWSVH